MDALNRNTTDVLAAEAARHMQSTLSGPVELLEPAPQ